MKKVAICIPAFSNPANIDFCIESVINSNNTFFDIDIFLYNNSNKSEITEVCRKLSNEYKFIKLFDYRINLGCSRTWNESIELTFRYHTDYETLIIINDDIFFKENSFVKFVKFALDNKNIPIIVGPNHSNNGFSVFAYNKIAYDLFGYFDENIYPAYFEDTDFANRVVLSGYKIPVFDMELVHLRNEGINNNPSDVFYNFHLPKIRYYYNLKWNNPDMTSGFNPQYKYPFNDESYGYKISLEDRKKPYLKHAKLLDQIYPNSLFLTKNTFHKN